MTVSVPNTFAKTAQPLFDQVAPLLLCLLAWVEGDSLLDLTLFVPAGQENEFWDSLLQLAGRQNVAGRLNRVFKYHADQLPASLLARFRAIYFGSLVRNVTLAEKGVQVVNVLQEAGIACLLLKGMALSQQLYGDLACRNSLDIDLLVQPKDVIQAAQLLEGLGYHFKGWPDRNWNPADCYDSGWQVTKVEINFDCPASEVAINYHLVDLHWDLSGTWWLGRLLQTANWNVFDRAYQLAVPELNQQAFIPTLSLEDSFVFLVIHAGVNHLFGEFSQFIDLDYFIRIYRHKLNWSLVLALLQKYRLKLITYTLLQPLLEEMATPLPDWFLAALRPSPLKALILKFWPYRPNLKKLAVKEFENESLHQAAILPLFDGYSLAFRAFWLLLFPGHEWLKTCYAAQTAVATNWKGGLLRRKYLNYAWLQLLHLSRKFKNLRELPR